MKKVAAMMLLSLLIGGAILEEAPKVTNQIMVSIEQSIDRTINSMLAGI